jgi:hypothetical protein
VPYSLDMLGVVVSDLDILTWGCAACRQLCAACYANDGCCMLSCEIRVTAKHT